MSHKNRITAAFRNVFLFLLIFSTYLGLQPIEPPNNPLFWDKLWHTIGHMSLFACLDVGFSPNKSLLNKFLILLSYGLVIEFIQGLLPYRTFSIMDLLANLLGLAIYLLIQGQLTKTKFYISISASE